MAHAKRCISMDNVNPNLKVMEYAVLGPLNIRAGVIDKELSSGVKKPFKDTIKTTIGDCHAMGQIHMTYIRQVLALVAYPEILMKDTHFPEDMKEKARVILKECKGGSIGSYSDSFGIEIIRRHVAEYITNRDGGIPSEWQNIILTSGASEAIKSVLNLIVCDVNGKPPGCLVPIPQYPLYSSTLAEFGIAQVGYYLNESDNWSLELSELERAVTEAKKTCNPRAMVVINPGNPTGQVLSRKNVEDIIKFAYKEKLFLLADEVYQGNVYAQGSEFHSFKKVLTELGPPYSTLELASFMSGSKGYMGECGLRSGYVELVNLCPDVKGTLLKAISAMLCPNVIGQVVMDCAVAPPKKGSPSYELFAKEKAEIIGSLAFRASMIANAFNHFEGVHCNPVQGALYAFPQITLPPRAIEAAKKKRMPADTFYAFELLERTGVCIVPGSGFGQKEGTFHFRTTILPQTEKLKEMLQRLSKFHKEFMDEYGGVDEYPMRLSHI